MSYILDALKKSEQERGQGNIPNVQTVHSSSLNYDNEKNTYWPYILIAAVLLNLLAISYFIFDKEKKLHTGDSPATTEKAPEATDTFLPTEMKVEVATKKELKTTQEKLINTTAENKNYPTINTKKLSPAPASKPTKTETTWKKETKKSVPRTSNKFITDYYDLPDSIKSQLPIITVSAHVFSTNPLQRSVVINNNFMEEGEYISNRLILHEITKDGAIFDYQGDLINYSIVSKWQ